MAACRKPALRDRGRPAILQCTTKKNLHHRTKPKEADMAAQFINASTPAARERLVPQTLASLAQAWQRYRSYRATSAQLNGLSIREREDIGLAGHDVDAVARDAVYRA
jgi:uncharacterized protein YjiS (DUF1127 family)